MASAISDLENFLCALLHDDKEKFTSSSFQKKTVAVAKISESTLRAENVTGSHAEKQLIDEQENSLRSEISKFRSSSGERPRVRVVLYLTYSPCMNSVNDDNKKCTEVIEKFFEDMKNDFEMTIEVVFSALYYIIRPSCSYDNSSGDTRCKHDPISTIRTTRGLYPKPLPEVSQENISGLRRLHGIEGITLRTFQESDWQDLMDCLAQHYGAMTTPPSSVDDIKRELETEYGKIQAKRTKEDDYMDFDLFSVLGQQFLQERITELEKENRLLEQEKDRLQQKDDMDMLADSIGEMSLQQRQDQRFIQLKQENRKLKEEIRQLEQTSHGLQKSSVDVAAGADKEGKEEDVKDEKEAGVEKMVQHLNRSDDVEKDEEEDDKENEEDEEEDGEKDEKDEEEGAVASTCSKSGK